MKYCLYKATSPSGKVYIGVTNNFKRRMKEHLFSQYSFGLALRKYGKESFTFEFELFDSVEEALERESELIGVAEVKNKMFYNETVGGRLSNVLQNHNPMHNQEVVDKHPSVWRKGCANPMDNDDSKAKMIKSQNCKRVSIDGVEYYGVREAARQLNISRQLVVYRLKSKSFTSWFYIK